MYFKENTFNFIIPQDLNMYYCGKRINSFDHMYGPAVRDHFLIVYIKDGCGTLTCNDRSYRLSPKHILVMFPDQKIFYKVDEGTPWTILWIGVYGKLVKEYLCALGITADAPVYKLDNFKDTESVLEEIFQASKFDLQCEKIYCISLVHKFFSVISQNANPAVIKNDYVKLAINFIKFNYNNDITVADIASSLNMDRSYLSKLFKKETGVSPSDWILNYKIKKACSLLEQTSLYVHEIAYSVGVYDQLYFSRIFKKKTGMCPSRYRKINQAKV